MVLTDHTAQLRRYIFQAVATPPLPCIPPVQHRRYVALATWARERREAQRG